MSSQPPIADDEFVLRRIAAAFYSPTSALSVFPDAFKPPVRDLHGLSVFRSQVLSPQDLIAALPESKRPGTAVARLAVADLTALGLTVVPEDAALPGHAIIPELSRPAYERDKPRVKVLLVELAKLASRDIVYETPP